MKGLQTKITNNFKLEVIKDVIKKEEKKEEIKDIYFNLVYKDNKYKVWYSSNRELEEIYRMNDVTINNKYKLRMYGNIESTLLSGKDINNIYEEEETFKYIRSKTVLKSNIQKCIRRGLDSEAIISSFALIKMDFLSFIRRIIVIAIEDVGIPDNLDVLVWLMVSYPNYVLTNDIINMLLNLVYNLCKHTEIMLYNSNSEYDVIDGMDEQYFNTNYITGLTIRKHFGGLKGDLEMIDNYIHHLLNNKEINIIKVRNRNLLIKRDMTRKDIILESIDFHCYPDLIYSIYNEINRRISSNQIKILIWEKSSKTNIRKNDIIDCYEEENNRDWNIIKDIVKRYQYNYRQNLKLY